MECPQCKGTMVANPAPDRRDIIRPMTQNGVTAPYAADKADSQIEKEQEHGVVHTCQLCRYQTRVKADAAEQKPEGETDTTETTETPAKPAATPRKGKAA